MPLATGIAIFAAGCATTGDETNATLASSSGATAEQERVISQQQSRINELQRELSAAKSAAEAPAMTKAAGDEDLFPPDVKPGECYARVLIPAQYDIKDETVVIKEKSTQLEIIPAQYDTVTERVLIKEASTRLEVIPATYESVTETVVVQPESIRIEQIPATYKTETERVLVSPARTEWKRGPASSFGSNVLQSKTADTGEIMCLVEVPAEYREVKRTVVDQPARTREINIPAVTKTVTKQVLATPATTREIEIPAEYGTVEVTKLVEPESERRIEIPAEYGTVTKRTKASEEKVEWRQVVCEVNLTPANVRTLQTALQEAGNYDGPIDGIIGKGTLAGANKYAKSKGLATGSNYISMDVAKRLGLTL